MLKNIGLVWLKDDFRLKKNLALAHASKNHDHVVVRDPKNDYGEDWLAHHYKEQHPSRKEVMNKLGL